MPTCEERKEREECEVFFLKAINFVVYLKREKKRRRKRIGPVGWRLRYWETECVSLCLLIVPSREPRRSKGGSEGEKENCDCNCQAIGKQSQEKRKRKRWRLSEQFEDVDTHALHLYPMIKKAIVGEYKSRATLTLLLFLLLLLLFDRWKCRARVCTKKRKGWP